MEESPEEFRERFHKDAENRVNELLEKTRKQTSAILKGMEKSHIADVFQKMPDNTLEQYFKVAFEQEDYEVCQVIKEEIEKRGINK